eukprot:SAG11_NODE_36350_length_262_cov_0.619632_1_plen_76_part_01
MCNSKPIFKDLRFGLKALLASTAKALGGLLPLHSSSVNINSRQRMPGLEDMGTVRQMLMSKIGPLEGSDKVKVGTE